MVYIGRFAPSPSGPLHFGSIVAALGSFLQAKSQNGLWLVRMEDIDIPRVQPGAAEAILGTLEQLQLYWDGEVIYQSQRGSAYREAEQHLRDQNLLYPCACTRRDVRGQRYPGRCRNGLPPGKAGRSFRVRTDDNEICFVDSKQGEYCQQLESDIGDFIIRRADNITAYHLAVVVDDAWQGVTEVVRGNDLLDSTPRQIYLQRLLGYPTPAYCHLPLAVGHDGQKISKQDQAPGVHRTSPVETLFNALVFLGQEPTHELKQAPVAEVIQWAIAHWRPATIPTANAIPVTD